MGALGGGAGGWEPWGVGLVVGNLGGGTGGCMGCGCGQLICILFEQGINAIVA